MKNRHMLLLALAMVLAIGMVFNCDSGDDDDDDSSESSVPSSGSIVISEIFYDPTSVDDGEGEWVELYNATGSSLNLAGCVFADNDHETPIETDLVIAADDFLIFGIGTKASHNSEVAPDWFWGTYNLGNAKDSVILYCNNKIVDQVDYSEEEMTETAIKGASLALCPDSMDADKNDSMDAWRFSKSVMSDGDFATPRAGNDPC
jgi:hypothetical protein